MAGFHHYKDKIVTLLPNKKVNNQKEDKEQKDSMHKQLHRHRILIFYRFMIVLSIIVATAVISYVKWKNKVYTDYEVVYSVPWTRTESMTSIQLENTIFSYTKDGMSCTDSKGNVLWNVTYEMQNPIVRTCKNVVAVGDYNGRKIYLCNTSKALGQIDTTIPIRDFCVSADGVVAAVLDDSTVTAIYLYDMNGKQLAYFKTTMSKSGYPLALDISDNSEMVALSYLQANNGTVSSSVAFYNFSSVGQNYTDNLVGGYGYADAIVPFVSFMNDETVFAVADNRLMLYEGNQTPVNVADVLISEEIQGIYYNENYIGLVFYNTQGGTQYRLDIYDSKGKKVNEIAYDMEYTNIQLEKECIIISNDATCEIYNWNGKRKYQGDFKERVYSIIPTSTTTKFTVVTEDAIQTVELR